MCHRVKAIQTWVCWVHWVSSHQRRFGLERFRVISTAFAKVRRLLVGRRGIRGGDESCGGVEECAVGAEPE